MFVFKKLKEILYPIDSPIEEVEGLTLGAVLVPIFYKTNRILFIRRSEYLKHHAGQIAFPGGKMEEIDKNLLQTCLRETEEEVGIKSDNIDILGRLLPVSTSSNFYVYPYVGLIEPDVKITIDPNEVEKVYFVTLEDLMNSTFHSIEEYGGEEFTHYHMKDFTVWGVTSKILTEFLSKLKEIEFLS